MRKDRVGVRKLHFKGQKIAKIHEIFSTERPPGTSSTGYTKLITRRAKLTNHGKIMCTFVHFSKLESFEDGSLLRFFIILIDNFCNILEVLQNAEMN